VNEWLLFHPMFQIPFFTGLLLAIALSLVGALLRLRDEWLAALGLSQVAAAGAMAAVWWHAPALVGAFGAAALAMGVRAALPKVGNSHHALMILIGWSTTLMIGARLDHGNVVGETFLRGQLYFTQVEHLISAVALCLLAVIVFPWLAPRLLTARFFPDYHQANHIAVWPYRAVYAGFVMGATVVGTFCMGAFPAFALLFVPSWIAFVLVDGWTRSVIASVGVGVVAYLLAFVTAMWLDQPFGPTLTAWLVVLAVLRFGRWARSR
jgi:zinc/manganese transport system permease protein